MPAESLFERRVNLYEAVIETLTEVRATPIGRRPGGTSEEINRTVEGLKTLQNLQMKVRLYGTENIARQFAAIINLTDKLLSQRHAGHPSAVDDLIIEFDKATDELLSTMRKELGLAS